jgi:hypothetical protein
MKNNGIKYDQNKIRWDLLPFDAISEIAKVMTLGAIKYEPRNWEKGMNWSRGFGAIQRHLTSWFHGQDLDNETRLSHLAHAGCCLFFMLAWELRDVGLDDRPKLDQKVLDKMANADFMQSIFQMMNEFKSGDSSHET